ncbi:hypothetical protein QOZ80_5AG0372660 [Eleusine coracana subsp. coracana]|nr:hypothetical protein QOZ80_5AG0372660 [Eleusine coracana subsp. coracana]
MKTNKTVNGPDCKKSKLFESLIGKDDSEIDPSYKLFLENLRIDGDTYVLDVPNGDHGMPVSVRYEENMSCGNLMDKNATDFPNNSLGRSWGAPKGKRKGEASSKAASGNVDHSFSPLTSSVKRKMKDSEIDESYELFLSLVKFKDGFMVIEPEPGVTIVYEQEEDMPARYDELRAGSSSNKLKPLVSLIGNIEGNVMRTQAGKIASENEMPGPLSEDLDGQDIICKDDRGHVLRTKSSDLNACKDDQGAQCALICSGFSTFDEKLNSIINQPYDQNEYEELWKKATDRKPVSRQRHLRSASKRYVTKEIGLSYLDHYPDLAVQIGSADSDERLSLLRKFFFWLENLCHEGAYMPWISRPLACDPISPDEYEPTLREEQ